MRAERSMELESALELPANFLQLPPDLQTAPAGGSAQRATPLRRESQTAGLELRIVLLSDELHRLEGQHASVVTFMEGLPMQLGAQLRALWRRCESRMDQAQADAERQTEEHQKLANEIATRLNDQAVLLDQRCSTRAQEQAADIGVLREAINSAEARTIAESTVRLDTAIQQAMQGCEKQLAEVSRELRTEFTTALESMTKQLETRLESELKAGTTRLAALEAAAETARADAADMRMSLEEAASNCASRHELVTAATNAAVQQESAERQQAVQALAHGLADEIATRNEGDVVVSKAIGDARHSLEDKLSDLEAKIGVDKYAIGELESWRQDQCEHVKRLSRDLATSSKALPVKVAAAEDCATLALSEVRMLSEAHEREARDALQALKERVHGFSEHTATAETSMRQELAHLSSLAQSGIKELSERCAEQDRLLTDRDIAFRDELRSEVGQLRACLMNTETECAQLRRLSDGPVEFSWCIDAFEDRVKAIDIHHGRYLESPPFRLRASDGLTLRLHPHGRLQSRPGVAALAVYQKRRFGNPFEASTQPVLRVLLRAAGSEAGPFELLAWDDEFDLAGTENFVPLENLLRAAGAGPLRVQAVVPF